MVPLTGALAGAGTSSSNNEICSVTGSVRASGDALAPVVVEKRVKVFIEKTIAALKALIALLELISQFIN
ncbi:TPA: hypothetical protein G8M40_004359 [Salmonella enterica]|nr:hypothetical protein [Salmonella enterica]